MEARCEAGMKRGEWTVKEIVDLLNEGDELARRREPLYEWPDRWKALAQRVRRELGERRQRERK
jgi:hypothetical protein